ncbi:MAG: potassium channel family protein [Candidatus Binatia bacterium]
MAACLYVLSADRPTLYVGAAVTLAVLGFELHLWPVGPQWGRALEDLLAIGLQIWVFAVVLRGVFRNETSELDAVIGALGAFLLLMMLFMRVHALLEALTPGSYSVQGPPLSLRSDAELRGIFQYFSTITLTTVGYGDIVPVAPAARLVAGIEAIVGQLYLAVVVATLVGRVAARRD